MIIKEKILDTFPCITLQFLIVRILLSRVGGGTGPKKPSNLPKCRKFAKDIVDKSNCLLIILALVLT